MSVVSIHVGQCGNQIGFEFFRAIAEIFDSRCSDSNFLKETRYRFFDENDKNILRARAVLVDTEPKVIEEVKAIANKSGTWRFTDNAYMKQQGAANNWAYGYSKHGPEAQNDVLEMVRKEVESCDWLNCILIMMSVAGGTGSGLGTFLTEKIRETYPKVCLVNQVVWPFSKGEITVQGFNTILSIGHLQNSSDALLLFENDQLQRMCSKRMGMKDISLYHMNSIASQQMSCLLLPSVNSTGSFSELSDILAHLVPHPQYKIAKLMSVPQESAAALQFSSYNWQSLIKTLRRMVQYGSTVDEILSPADEIRNSYHPSGCLSNVLVLRGLELQTADYWNLDKSSLPYVNRIPPSQRFQVWTHPQSVFGHEKLAVLASNGQFIASPIENIISKAWKMFSVKAYLHQYTHYDVTEDDFINNFACVEQIVASYKNLK